MKQFIVDRHTTPNTPKLEQVPTEKIPIYETAADADADLANLAVGQIIGIKDTGDELSHPVDVVEEDNLHAVSSNAVFENCPRFPDYANQITIPSNTSSWTATEDCYVTYAYTGAGNESLFIDGYRVSVADLANGNYSVHYSGYVKKGALITTNAVILGSDRIMFRAFPLI